MCALCPFSDVNLQKVPLLPSSTFSTEIRGFLLYTTLTLSLLKTWSSETEKSNFSSLTMRAM